MAQMASVFAELERAMIRERTRAAMKVKRDRRERTSGHEPYGWDFGANGRLIENHRGQPVEMTREDLRGEEGRQTPRLRIRLGTRT